LVFENLKEALTKVFFQSTSLQKPEKWPNERVPHNMVDENLNLIQQDDQLSSTDDDDG